MKIVAIIVSVLMLLGTAFVALAAANKAHKFAGDISELTHSMSDAEKAAVAKEADLPSTGRLNGGAIVGGLGGLAAIVLLVAAFAKKAWVNGLVGATVGCALVSTILYPYIATGPADGAAPRTLAIAAIVMSALGGAAAWFKTTRTTA
jgi:hypothetical protein